MKPINEADLDLFEVTPWLCVTSNEFDSLLVEKVVLLNQSILLLYSKIYLKWFKVTPYYGTYFEYI